MAKTCKDEHIILFTVTRCLDHVDLQSGQVPPTGRRVQVAGDRHARHPLQLEHVQHVSDRHDDQVGAIPSGVYGERDRVLLVYVRVSVSDDHSYVRDVAPVAVTRREHVVLLRTGGSY